MTLYECLKQGFQTGDYKKAKDDWWDQENKLTCRIGDLVFSQELAIIDLFLKNKIKIDEELLGPWVYLFRRSFQADEVKTLTKCLEIYHLKIALKAIKDNDKQVVFDYLETENSFKRDEKLKLLSFEAAKYGNWNILEELLEKGARLNPLLFENKEQSLLIQAAQYQHKDIVYRLLQRGAKVFLKERKKEALLKSYKQSNDYQKMTDLLLLYASLLLKKNEKKESDLAHRLINGSYIKKDVVNLLNKHPLLSMEIKNEKGQGIFEEAIDNNDGNLASTALSFGVSLTGKTKEGKSLLEAAVQKDRHWFLKLFEQEALKNEAQKGFKNGILNEAIKNISLKTITYLIKENILLDEKDEKGRTPLMNAYFIGDILLLEPLLEATKDINQEDNSGQTALFYAVRSSKICLLNQLLRLKRSEIKIDQKDHFGKTALMNAVLMNNHEIIQKLLEEGADILIKNNEGKDVFNLTMSEGNITTANLIKRAMKKRLGLGGVSKKLVLPKKKVTNWAHHTQNQKF